MDVVTSKKTESLLARVRALAQSTAQDGDALVPVDEFAIYYLLASEIARMAVHDGGEGLSLFVDAQTARQVDTVDSVRGVARQVVVFGAPPEAWSATRRLIVCPQADGVTEHDLFLTIVSPQFGLALVCEQGKEGIHGVWTAQWNVVAGVAQALAEAAGLEMPAALEAGAPGIAGEDRSLKCALRLVSLLVRQLTSRQRDMAMDKDDLFSVLNILKAVSAKRRAHDILFVFVEQIARAVHMDRCSVVRVWGGDNVGHVLASHEDETIVDLEIDLKKYPEIRRAMEIRQKVVINDTRRDPLMRPFVEDLIRARIDSLIVIPVVLFDQNVGSLLLRAARERVPFPLREISFCEIVAGTAANALERSQLFENIQKVNEQLQRLAVTDGLTGLYNHRYFRDRLESEFERARRYMVPLSCLIMDIDNFKKVNDTFGHLQGDSILREIAARTLQTVRKSDIVARYGGEEFVVIMPQTGAEGAKAYADRICREISEGTFEGMPTPGAVTVSVGVAVFDPDRMFDCEALIRVADGALYRAKHEGKNRVIVGEP